MAKMMFEAWKKETDPESNKTKPDSDTEETQKPEEPQTTDLSKQVDPSQIIAEPLNTPDDSDLLASFQKMKKEEEELLEQKQDLITKAQGLQSKLTEEIEKKKTAIKDLKSEIPGLQNKCNELAQALGIPSTSN
jgi:predicted RNase H-like nuclease (RuvC/YqgF family)